MTHITIEREKLERVLEALEVLIMKHYELTGEVLHKETYAVLEKALAQPPQRQPLTDVIKAAQGVLEWTEIAHRPPIPDRLENGRMVRVRLHALAYLHDALAAHGIKENT